MARVTKERIDIGRLKEGPNGWERESKIVDSWKFLCPGCGYNHSFWMDGRWTFDGNEQAPTFSPSLLLKQEDGWRFRCHSFVQGGKIVFLDDCTHAMRGQTVDLPEL